MYGCRLAPVPLEPVVDMDVEEVMFAVEDCVAVTFPPKLNELPSTFPPPSVHAPGEMP